MPLDLHINCITQLVDALTEKLNNVRVIDEVYLDYASLSVIQDVEKILPSGFLQNRLAEIISDTPLFDFIFETLNRILKENHDYKSDSGSMLLSEIQGFSDLHLTANRLISEFNSLPHKYTIFFEFNLSIGKILRRYAPSYNLTNTIKIICPDDTFDKTNPLQSGIKGRDHFLFLCENPYDQFSLMIDSIHWNQETSYLQFDVDGFIGLYSKTATIENVISKLKAFIGLSLAIGLFKIDYGKFDFSQSTSSTDFLVIHKSENNNPQIWSTYRLPREISTVFRKIDLLDYGDELPPDKVEGWITHNLSIISAAFKNKSDTESLLLACEWIFDSYTGNNDLLSFVEANIVMEILLGGNADFNKVGIVELISNRIAYLIGGNPTERDKIIRDFKEIYDVRSAIVHRGQSKLSVKELGLLDQLRLLCKLVIKKEISQMILT